ncbi:MAG TPA: amidohydrolase family protein [Jatrophihabitans sp.]|nr:amidohydrolase family protein [Jatrophihabitans sp.]
MIDDHVHPFPLEFAPLDLATITLDVHPDPAGPQRRRAQAPGRLYLHLLETKLADLLGVDPADAVAARDREAAADWPTWVQGLFDDAEITGMVMDEATSPAVPTDPSGWAGTADRPVWWMARIDPVVDDLLGSDATAKDVVGAVEDAMQTAVTAGAVAFKTILAYRTGLAVDPTVDLERAQRELDGERGQPVRRRGKALRDLVLRRVLERAADLDRPIQIHTGFGDSELRLRESDPTLLEDVLRTPGGQAARVVLIHGSFPWTEAAAYLATTKPNVWMELSLSNLFAPVGTAQRLVQMLDVAPVDRLLLGSDGHGQPETHWFGCRVLVEAWEQARDVLLRAGARTSWVEAAQDAMFEDNARTVYALTG